MPAGVAYFTDWMTADLGVSIEGQVETWYERIAKRNAWVAVSADGSGIYETRIELFLCGWLMLHCLMMWVAPRFGRPLSLRPTILASSLHSTVTATCALCFLLLDVGKSDVGLYWQHWVLPFTLS